MMHILDAVLKGILLGLFMAISVGPTLFAIIKYSLHHHYTSGIAFVLGVSVSDIMYVSIANLAAHWLEVLKGYNRYIAFGGAVILIIVGLFGVIRKHVPVSTTKEPVIISGGHYFRIGLSGFLINSINPGVLITWLAAVSATANTSNFYRVTLFGTCLGLILSLDFLKVFLAEKIRQKLTPRRVYYLHKIAAICILVIGIALFISTTFNIQFGNGQ